MKTIAILALLSMAIAANASTSSQLVYLSCDVPATNDHPANHFDFTLDEQNGTVSFYVKAAEATNKEKAVFGPQTVTWTTDLSFGSLTRTINRTDLSFAEDLDIAGSKTHQVGQCSLVEAPKRKF